MFKTRPCGCKGLRSCKICESEYGAWKISGNITKENSFVYCPYCKKLWPGWDGDSYKHHPNHSGEPLLFSGIEVHPDFITTEEEMQLLKHIDEVPWDLSQSGRYKQNYGPKCNFKKRKVSTKNFYGYPESTKFVQERFKTLDILKSFETVEQCSLDYTQDRGSSIDPHIDDCWIWGERIPTLSLLSDSVLTLTKFSGPKTRYNLESSLSYPRIVKNGGRVKTYLDIEKELEGLKSLNKSEESEFGKDETETESCSGKGLETSPRVIRIPLPRRSLIVLFSDARYDWEHSILREDITDRRVCITYRELTPQFLSFGSHSEIGRDILRKSKQFWDHETGVRT